MVAAPLPEARTHRGAAVGMAVVVVPADRPFESGSSAFPPLDEAHLVERLGAFTIIVCGESFVKVAIAVSDSTVDGDRRRRARVPVHPHVRAVGVVLRGHPARGHQPAPARAVARVPPGRRSSASPGTAIGVSKLVALGFFEQLPAEDILEIMATLAVVYLGLAGIGLVHAPPADPAAAPACGSAPRSSSRVVGFGAWKVPWFDLLEGVAMLTLVAVGHAFLVRAPPGADGGGAGRVTATMPGASRRITGMSRSVDDWYLA